MAAKRAREEFVNAELRMPSMPFNAADVQRAFDIDASLRIQAAMHVSQYRCERLMMIRKTGPVVAMAFSLTRGSVPNKLFVECTYTASDLDPSAPFEPIEEIFRKTLIPGQPWCAAWTRFAAEIFRSMVHANEEMLRHEHDAARAPTAYAVLRITLMKNKHEIFSCVCKVVAPFMAADIRVPDDLEFDGNAYIIGYETKALAEECAAWTRSSDAEAHWHTLRIANGRAWGAHWKERTVRKLEEMIRAKHS